MAIDASYTIAGLVLELPARARVFEELGLDYCCGGKRSLEEACADRGVDPAVALAALEAAAETDPTERDWRRAPLAELCDHIVSVHHARLRQELPRLDALLGKVVLAHGEGRPELHTLHETFRALRAELEEHMGDEEERVFPRCLDGSGPEPEQILGLEDEHAATGAALARLRSLAAGYDLELALCNTHRATLDGLRELEADLHRHIHEENNVLFPRALAFAA